MIYKVAFFDNHPQPVRKAILSVAPENYEVTFAESYDIDYLTNMLSESDFIIYTGAGPDLSPDMIKSAKKLRLIQKWGIGVDKISIETAKEMGIPVAITAGANAIPVAEMTVGMMLSALRRIPVLDKSVRDGKWLKTGMRDTSFMLCYRTVGLIGMGFISRRVAHLLKAFDVDIIYYDIMRASPEVEKDLGVTFVEFDDLISRSDIISIHIPLTEGSRNLIAKKQFDSMKPTAFLINIARGPIVFEADLIEALKNKKINGAAFDVYEQEPPKPDNELFTLDNIVLSPHVGGSVIDNVPNMAAHCFKNMQLIEQNKKLSPRDRIV